MDKKAWRKRIIASQEKLTDQERNDLSQQIGNRLLQYTSWQRASTVALFHSIGKEVDTLSLLQEGWNTNKQMYLPKCYREDRSMIFYKIDTFEQLEVVYMGIPEPNPELCEPLELSKLDLMIVPGVVFARDGYRIGYGGGYYDRFLAQAPATFEKVSLAYSFQVVDVPLPKDSFDIPVDTLITEEQIIFCQQARKEER